MAELQKLSSYKLDDLPDEVALNILGFLNLKQLLLCGQVSKRLRAIGNDKSLWLNLNLCQRKVPYDFIEKAAGNGCQYLSLVDCNIIGWTGKSKLPFNLKYLNVCGQFQGAQKLVQNFSSLQKLSLAGSTLDSDDIQHLCQNTQTLKVLDLRDCKIDLHCHTELVQDLLTNCAHLTELNIGQVSQIYPIFLDGNIIKALVDNLTPTILKVSLGGQPNLQDEHVKKLVERCNNITHLNLSDTLITNDSVHSIIDQLKASLKKIDVAQTNVDFATLIQLKSMPALKTLICDDPIENLKQQLSHISINEEEDLLIAKPFKRVNKSYNFEWIWEIRAKKQDLFAKR